ncbi:hypothetical protein [Leifsonia sp. 22587]|uniref:hypothetical protein n=1 Tax=Leifsonia sp. 22587 TaxID=3453946 RepID=UPI003F82A05F
MTSWPEQPPTGQPQAQTRRQAREFERSAARRAGTSEPTPGGQIPEMTTTAPPRDERPVETDAVADEARVEEPSVEEAQADETRVDEAPAVPTAKAAAPADERPAIPASAFAEPGVTSPSRDAFDFFRQSPDPSQPEPVTQPMAILQPAQSAQATQSAQPAQAPAAGATAPSTQTPTGERTLTRRELRAMLQAQEANAQANHAPAPGEAVFPVSFTSGPEGGSAEAEADTSSDGTAATEGTATAATSIPAPAGTPSNEKSSWPFASFAPSSAQTAPTSSRSAQDEPTVTQSPTSPFAAFGAPIAAKPASDAPEEPAAVAAPEEPAEDTSAQERRPFTPPTGHWSTAAELEDQNQPITTRNVAQSTAATTTNALILPVIPQPDTKAPLTSTGEILVTGSIDLPRGMGATGAHPDRIDSSDIDRLLDGEENEFNTSEVQPVRASRAISTHTSTRGVITPPKKRGNALPVVLMVTAGVLAVGVIGLLVAAYVLKVF